MAEREVAVMDFWNWDRLITFIEEGMRYLRPPEKVGVVDDIYNSLGPFGLGMPDGTLLPGLIDRQSEKPLPLSEMYTWDLVGVSMFVGAPVARFVETLILPPKPEREPRIIQPVKSKEEKLEEAERRYEIEMMRKRLSEVAHDSEMTTFFLGYVNQATGQHDISYLEDTLGPVLPAPYKRGSKLARAGLDFPSAWRSYLTEKIAKKND